MIITAELREAVLRVLAELRHPHEGQDEPERVEEIAVQECRKWDQLLLIK
jgi:hypothetical protein